MTKKGLNAKYGFLFAFILGMTIMVVIFVFFEATTDSDYRVRTGDVVAEDILENIDIPITLTSNSPSDDISDTSSTPTVFLGVQIVPVNDIIAEQLELKNSHGVLINKVIANSPAQIAGLKRVDVITSLDNKSVRDINAFREAIEDFEPDDRIRITFFRSGIKDSTYAVLAANTTSVQSTNVVSTSASITSTWGVTLSPLTDALKDYYAIPSSMTGVLVLSVEPGGVADLAGLSKGDIITGVDTVPVNDLSDFFNAIEADQNSTALLNVYSQGSRSFIAIDSSSIIVSDPVQTETTLLNRIFSFFKLTGGIPFTDEDEEEEEEGPKGGKFAPEDENITLSADSTAAFNRPTDVVGDTNTGGTSSTSSSSDDTATGMNRPSSVPSQTTTTGSNNDVVFFIALLLLIIVYLTHREFYRPQDK